MAAAPPQPVRPQSLAGGVCLSSGGLRCGCAGLRPAFPARLRLVALAIAAILFFVAACAGEQTRHAGASEDASILLITADTLRADHVGAYGSQVRTPAIDGLARDGVLFENAITPAVMTLPSHASILTGTYPPTHGIRDNGDYRLAASALTLAEVLRARGFRTGAVVSSFVLDSMFGLEQGFDVYDDALPLRRPNETFFPERHAFAVTDSALRFIEGAGQARFFLWAHYFDPHFPYVAPEAFSAQYPKSGYAAEVAYLDAELGRLLAGLRARGLMEKTLVVFVADHGEGLSDHGEESHGVFLYDETARVPLIVSFPPRLPAGRKVKGVVRTVDIMPTILDLAGIALPEVAEPAQGISLQPLIDGKGESDAGPAYSEAMVPLLMYGWSPLTFIRDSRYKYIQAPRPELYDLLADPGETKNLVAARTDVAADFRARLEALKKDVTRSATAAETLSPDPEVEAKLRSLGYVSGGSRPAPAPTTAGAADLADPKDMVETLDRINRIYASFGGGEFDEVVQEARSILAANPDNASVRYYLAGALVSLGRHDEALREFDALIARSPRDTEALSNKGWCLINMERYEEAAAVFEQVLKLNPSHVHARASLGNIAFVRGNYDEAQRIYEDVLKREPDYLPSILTLAKMHTSARRSDEAAALYERAVTIDPSNVDAWMSLAWLRLERGKNAEALAILDRATARVARDPRIQGARGDVLMGMGRIEEARAAYQAGTGLDEHYASGWYGLGLIELRQGDPAKAVELLRRAVELSPRNVPWHETLGHALARAGQPAAATREFELFLSSGQVPPQKRAEILKAIESLKAR